MWAWIVRRSLLLVIVGALATGGVAIAAHLDHEHKGAVMNRLQVDEWFCANRGERCGGESSARIERRWVARERAYEAAFATAAAMTLVAAAAVLVRRRSLGALRAPGA